MTTFYKPDTTQSVVDPAKMKAYVKRLAPQMKLMLTLQNLVASSVRAPELRDGIANCVIAQIAPWARQNAFLGNLDVNSPLGHRQALMVMIWSSVTISNAYAVSRATHSGKEAEDADIIGWFRRMTAEQIAEFTPRPRAPENQWLDAHANHWLWAGAAVSSLATLTNDRKSFDWAMTILQQALDEAPDDGGLPLELSRGQRAVHYQSFATTAIAVMLANADANGHALTPAQEAKLKSIARFSLDSYLDPTSVQARTGKPQERKADMLTWAPAFAVHFEKGDPAFAAELTRAALSKGVLKTTGCSMICMPVYKAALEQAGLAGP